MISGTEIGIILYTYNRQSINGCATVAKAVDLWDVHLLLSRQWINQCTSAVAKAVDLWVVCQLLPRQQIYGSASAVVKAID